MIWTKVGDTSKTGWVTSPEIAGKQGHDLPTVSSTGGLSWDIPQTVTDGTYIIQAFKFKDASENYLSADDTGARLPMLNSAEFTISGVVSVTPQSSLFASIYDALVSLAAQIQALLAK